MQLRNKAAAFFAVIIVLLVGFALYRALQPPVSVVIQAGHEGRTCGNTGAVCAGERETVWNRIVANSATKMLRKWGIDVKRIGADDAVVRARIAVAIHFDSAKRPCRSGASVGYPDTDASKAFASRWKKLYRRYFPFGWHDDNFTDNLRHYYAYRLIPAEKFLVLELGELTCERQRVWLKPRLEWLGELIAYAVAKELGHAVDKPKGLQ